METNNHNQSYDNGRLRAVRLPSILSMEVGSQNSIEDSPGYKWGNTLIKKDASRKSPNSHHSSIASINMNNYIIGPSETNAFDKFREDVNPNTLITVPTL